MRIVFGVLAAAALFGHAQAADLKALSGDSLLDANGREARLAGVVAPSMHALDYHGGPAPMAEAARDALQALLARARLRDAGVADRWGRRAVDLGTPEAPFAVQVRLVSEGWAQVDPQTEDTAKATALMAAEAAARTARRGLWASPIYGVRDASDTENLSGAFHVIEGTVRDVGVTRARTYLNFGADYHTDFTVSVARADLKRLLDAGVDPRTMKGARLRVRGFVGWANGPAIEWRTPQQVEILGVDQ